MKDHSNAVTPEHVSNKREALLLNDGLGLIQESPKKRKKASCAAKKKGLTQMNWSDVAEFVTAYNYAMVYFANSQADLEIVSSKSCKISSFKIRTMPPSTS